MLLASDTRHADPAGHRKLSAARRQLTAVDPRDRAAVSELLNPPTERERKRAARVKLALDTALLGDHRLRTQLVASTGFSVRAVRMRSDLAACVVTWGCYPGADAWARLPA